tara:strand:- start:552 stop:950 length:399 start_codon:yes stop_codon:yes gene_type:complete
LDHDRPAGIGGDRELGIPETGAPEVVEVNNERPFQFEERLKNFLELAQELPTQSGDGAQRMVEEIEASRAPLLGSFTPVDWPIALEYTTIDDEIEIAVTDTGLGIPHSYRERVFEKLGQVDKGSRFWIRIPA